MIRRLAVLVVLLTVLTGTAWASQGVLDTQSDALDLEGLERKLAGRCWALSLRDRTRAGRDLWARMEEDSLTGLFLRSMAARCRKEPDNDMLQQAVRFGLAALENGEDIAP